MTVARYRVLADSYIGDELVKAGREIDYPGWPGKNLEPINEQAAATAERYAELRKSGGNYARSPAEDKKAAGKAVKPDGEDKTAKAAKADAEDKKAAKK